MADEHGQRGRECQHRSRQMMDEELPPVRCWTGLTGSPFELGGRPCFTVGGDFSNSSNSPVVAARNDVAVTGQCRRRFAITTAITVSQSPFASSLRRSASASAVARLAPATTGTEHAWKQMQWSCQQGHLRKQLVTSSSYWFDVRTPMDDRETIVSEQYIPLSVPVN